MTSQLASQLQRLQQRPDESRHRLAKSFLFSTQDAQGFSREQIHQLALNGLQTLTAMDNRFHPFIQDLFDVKRVRQERAMLMSSEDAALRASLEHFLTLLSPHLFLTAAQQVFEFLVRVYEVHIYDASAVLRAFLPYHDHNIFARALLLLDLRDTGFDFLSTNQLRGAPLLREHLTLACAESRKAARLVCLTVAMPFRYGIRHHAANALFTGVVTQLATHKDGEALWRTFLPFVLELLSGAVTGAEAGTEESKRTQQLQGGSVLQRNSRVSQESVATALVVLVAWSGQVRFSSSMLNTVLKPIFRYLTSAVHAAVDRGSSSGGSGNYLPVRDLLAFLEILFATQHRALTDVAVSPLLQSLLALPWRTLASQLPFADSTEVVVVGPTGMPSASPRHSVLLATLLQTALDRLARASEARLLPSDVVEFLSTSAEDLPLSNAMAASYLRVLMTAEASAVADMAEGDSSTLYHRVVAALERRYAVVFDEVLSEVLLHADTAAAASAFLARHFQGTRYSLVEVGSALPGMTETLPLFACLLHPVAEVRALAAKTLQGMTVAQWMGGSFTTANNSSSSSAAQAEGHSLIGLFAHVLSYEHITSVAEAFVATGTAMVRQLTAHLAQDDTISASCLAACKLVRALYSMVLSLLESHADHPTARAEALQRVVLPLLKFLLRPAVTAWTVPQSPSAATRQFRACVLYHVTLLFMQRTATGGSSALAEMFGEGAGLLELGFGDVSGLSPLLKAASAPDNGGRARGVGSTPGKGRRTAAADSSDDAEEEDDGATLSSVSLALFKALMQCEDLLKEIHAEAQEHLAEAFAAARTAVRESSESNGVDTVELVVALAATLLPVREPASALQAVSTIMAFLCGSDNAHGGSAGVQQEQQQEGYLNLAYAALLEKTSVRRAAQTGRGAADAAAVARRKLHRHPLVQMVALVLRTALRHALALPDATTTASSALLTVSLCKLLAYTGASLPPVTLQAEALATAYLDLINEAPVAAVSMSAAEEVDNNSSNKTSSSTGLWVDWYALVTRAVFGNVGDEDEGESKDGAGVSRRSATPPSSLAALALIMFLPLRAPTTQRLQQLRTLQDAVVSAGGGRNAASCVHAIVAAAMRQQQQNGASVTALSCIIECMAVEERQYQLTSGAAELLCGLLTLRRASAEPVGDDASTYVVPAGWAYRVIRYFFAASSNSAERRRGTLAKSLSSSTAVTPQQMCLTQKLLLRVEGILSSSGTATRSASRIVTADTADLVDAVCSRVRLWGAVETTEEGVKANASVRMMEVLLRHPYLHVRNGGGARPVYRHALTALTIGLSAGLEDRRQGHRTIYTSKAKKTSSTDSSALSRDYQRLVAAQLRSTVLHAMDIIGTDVAVACMSTLGGYEYFFLPALEAIEDGVKTAAEEDSEAVKRSAARRRMKVPPPPQQQRQQETGQMLQRVREMLEALAPVGAESFHGEATEPAVNANEEEDSRSVRWCPPGATVVSNPLTYADAVRVLRLPHVCAMVATEKWGLDSVSQQSLGLLRVLLRMLPTIVMDDEEEQESAYHLVKQCLELYPLQEMEGLLRQAAVAAAADDVALMPRVQQVRLGARGPMQVEAVLRYVEDLVRVCTEQTLLLTEKVADGAYHIKSCLLREMMVLMARVLVDSEAEEDVEAGARTDAEKTVKADVAAQEAADAAERRRGELHFHVDTIASLLRSTAPLLKLSGGSSVKTAASAAAKDDQNSVTYLHIPLVSLLIKLEPIENTEALGFRSAREVCQDILTSFDIRTQVQCVAQLMRLVADPAAQLASSVSVRAVDGREDESEIGRVQHLLRRMVKPNQVINRQETIMHLVNLTVKSDLFLEPFLTLQRHARSSQPPRASKMSKRSESAAAKAEHSGDEADDDDGGDKAEGMMQREDGGCMELLVSALELFAHYHDLHADVRAADSASVEVAEADAETYTALLELLAGNTLACVLAGINEPTFIVCQQRLLEDKRDALRKIGLEVLLDRLHHSLPTLENVLSDEEMEAHRRRLRDPRVRLSLVDLVRIKARPLTTKRSTILFPLLVTGIRANLSSFHAFLQSSTTSAQPMGADQLLETAQLGIACAEELIRIVSSGGSLQSEQTLLNANRSRRVTEATLVKLFGNRSRVMEVREFVETVCDCWMPLLTRCEMRLRGRGASHGAEDGSSPSLLFYAAAEEGVLGCMTCLVTALATITQVMGTAFATAHSLSLLHTLVSAGMYQVVEMPGLVSRGQAGALLRHSTLSSLIRCFPACWQMTQPYLPSLLFIASHLTNVTDAESHYLCSEMLAVLEAVMEPQLLLDAGTACLRGVPYVNGAVVPASEQHKLANLISDATGASSTVADDKGKRPAARRSRQARVQAHTHSFSLLFTCFERRIEHLSKEALMHMPTLMEGTRPQQSFWLAAFNSLASAPAVPSSEALLPVLQAFTVFLLKFKAKHGALLLRIVADWAFAETSGGVADTSRKHADADSDDAGEHDGRGHDGEAQSISRLTLQSWIIFFALGNHLLSKLGSILDFAFPIFLPHVVMALRTYCAATATVSKATDSLVALALEGALECLRGMALAQTPGPDHDYSIQMDVYFANADVFPGVMPALVHQLHNLQYLEDGLHDYRFRVEHNVIPAIRAFMACLGSSKLQSKTQAEVVRALRHPSRHVRREALVCLDGIYADGGDELASRLMAEMLPTAVELTEDRDDAVVEEARKLCNNLSHMTGQDVLYAMT
ncbi:hypothetical protein ABL78_2286 [Leptomonas seymouri]|uniref:HEAT repeat-containing protein 1 n=1 Tax=Leptomonas seymouri TaxID=5684 RepID=A0A0N1I130_LEPSE|nr:hypothetical protein ABL78_2286 [Leptomonas seymouri]|eukprot:KPI88618.1 hypothetical protein ABL78_2286 [Leptomonas seymouri]